MKNMQFEIKFNKTVDFNSQEGNVYFVTEALKTIILKIYVPYKY